MLALAAASLSGAAAARAEPLTFEAAMARAASDAPDLRASALGVDAARAAVVAAGRLPDQASNSDWTAFP